MKKKVEVIEPKQLKSEKHQKKRVAAYARVSTDGAGQKESLQKQKKYYKEMLESNPYNSFVGLFADEAISGTTDKRPAFQEMIKLAESGMIDEIYTKSISRFSRNVSDLLGYCERLKKVGTNVIFEENGINLLSEQGSLMLTILGAVAQMEVENTSSHVNWTFQKKMSSGKLVGQANPLGYDLVNGELVINEEEAKIVRYIYRRYLEGIGAHTIAKELEAMRVVNKRGNRKWYDSSVMVILKNEKYTGDLLQGKTVTVNPIGHKRKKNEGEGRQYYVKDDHEAIVSREDWENVQRMIDQRCISYVDGRKKGTTKNTAQSDFTTKLVCGYCGRNYVRRTTHANSKYKKIIWQCSTYCKQGKQNCPYCQAVDEEYIKVSIVGMIRNLLNDTTSGFYLTDKRLNELLKKNKNKMSRIEEQIDSCRRAIVKNQKKIANALDLYSEGAITGDDYETTLKKTREEIENQKRIVRRLEALVKSEDVKCSSVMRVKTLINEGKAEGFDKELFELLVEKIVVGGKRSDLVDDPRSLHFELKDYNLDTDFNVEIIDGKRHYYSDEDMENEHQKGEVILNSPNSIDTHRHRR